MQSRLAFCRDWVIFDHRSISHQKVCPEYFAESSNIPKNPPTILQSGPCHRDALLQRSHRPVIVQGRCANVTRGSILGPGQSELLEPKIIHKVQPFDGQRTSWKTFEFQWRAYLIAQDRKYRELLYKIKVDVLTSSSSPGVLIRPSAIGKVNSPFWGNITSFALSLFE